LARLAFDPYAPSSSFLAVPLKARLPAMGVSQVVTPLANGETVKPMVFKRFLTITSNRPEAKSSHSWGGSSSLANQNQGLHKHNHHQQQHDRVDVVFMTLWFWSTAPVPRDFLPLTRRFAPHAKVRITKNQRKP